MCSQDAIRSARRTLSDRFIEHAISVKTIVSNQKTAFTRSLTIMRCFYVLTFIIGIELCSSNLFMEPKQAEEWLWPVFWLKWTDARITAPAILGLLLAGALASAQNPLRIAARIATALGLVLALAANYSFGKIDHGYHFWIWTAVLFCLAPCDAAVANPSRLAIRQRYLLVFFAAQLTVALFFSVSGTWKIAGALYQFAIGEVGAFSPEAMARQIAEQFLTTHETTAIGRIVVENPQLGWPAYVFVIYLETFSILAAFRPSIHRFWGLMLMLFQLGTRLTLNVWSPWGVAIVGLLFVASPFAPDRSTLWTQVRALPLIHEVIVIQRAMARTRRGRAKPVHADRLARDQPRPAA